MVFPMISDYHTMAFQYQNGSPPIPTNTRMKDPSHYDQYGPGWHLRDTSRANRGVAVMRDHRR